MKKIIPVGYNFVSLDTETLKVTKLDTDREAINGVMMVNEDAVLVIDDTEVEVHKNDILVKFYDSDFKNKVIVVTSKEWAENITEYRDRVQKQKEEWALKQKENPICGDCESCNCGKACID